MRTTDVRNNYFDWLVGLVNGRDTAVSYRKLLLRLHETEFRWVMPRDENRADDGISLRWRYAYDKHMESQYPEIMRALEGESSILEMMIALAIRCEETMDDNAVGDRTSQWFWGMVKSLGLDTMYDNRFDSDRVNDILERFLDREYEPNGRGGLFYIRDCKDDLRCVEIWSQLWWYVDTIA